MQSRLKPSSLTEEALQKYIDGILESDPALDRLKAGDISIAETDRIVEPAPQDNASIVDVSSLLLIADPTRFVREAYLRILNRIPSDREVAERIRTMQVGLSTPYVVFSIVNSDEAGRRGVEFQGYWKPLTVPALTELRGTRLVRSAFRRILWRDPTFEELRRYFDFLSQSGRPAQLIYELSQMPEAALYPPLEGLDELRPRELADLLSIEEDAAFLREAYQLILRRPADLGGLQTHLSQLKADSRPGVLFEIALSQEAQRLPRQFLFNGRLVTETSGVLKRRRGFREVVAGIMARFGSVLLPGTQARLTSIENQITRQIAAIEETSGISVPELLEPLKSEQVAIREELATLGRLSSEMDQPRTRLDTLARKFEAIESLQADLRRLIASQERVASELNYNRAEAWAAFGRFGQKIESMESHQTSVDERLQRLDSRFDQLGEQINTNLKPVFPVGDRLLATVINGFLMLLPADDVRLAAYMAICGNLDPGMIRFLSRILQPGMTFVDVGANIGTHTLTAASRVQDSGRVYSFEPTPRTCGILRTNVTINGFTGRVVIQELAVSDKRGSAKLWTGDVCGHNTLFGNEQDPRPAITVSTISLDEALAAVPVIDFVKIDAEGAEPFILRGMRQILSRRPKLQLALEFAPVWLEAAGFRPADFLDEMLGLGFIIEQIDDVTGETVIINREKILHAESVNLYLHSNAT